MKGRNGFTLMELMIVIAIIMILSGAIVARITTGTEKAKYAKANGEMAEIASAIRAFYMDTGYWPYKSDAREDPGLVSVGSIQKLLSDSGSDVEVTGAIQAKWKGPYLEAMEWPMDPWGANRYWVYYYTTSPYKAIYVLCLGSDRDNNGQWDWTTGKVNSGDDIMLLVHRF